MIEITKEELLNIARIANIRIYEEEIPGLIKQLQDLLRYASSVSDYVSSQPALFDLANKNVTRADDVIPTDPTPILAQVPEREESYFVVPRILDHK